ncbi:Hypothetical protein PAU_03534 [Photorhabdus asymbiotica]|uniref:Uncharacterized protein n=1 Tax=Photorhabdus asymbiotica subsp. asymbiotica (strain ATCC 43949 / 3105-77) TaxID=553480 RepID=C7BKC5_PHOAA|nr:Hypothetical protein PAU_03534 [Photorhabdus asymbiotica]
MIPSEINIKWIVKVKFMFTHLTMILVDKKTLITHLFQSLYPIDFELQRGGK